MKNEDLKIAVVGVGSGAQNIIDYLSSNNQSKNIDFVVINSDENILNLAKTKNKLLIHGEEETFYGLGCGGNVTTGKQYAEFCINKIESLFNDTDIAVLISCFGGGCGTGATPVIAQMLKNKDVKTIAIISKPFDDEGKPRKNQAVFGIEKMKNFADKLILTDNQDLINTLPSDTTLKESWNYMNNKIAELLEKEITELVK
jgi:cell division protein FtsZ